MECTKLRGRNAGHSSSYLVCHQAVAVNQAGAGGGFQKVRHVLRYYKQTSAIFEYDTNDNAVVQEQSPHFSILHNQVKPKAQAIL